LDEDVKAAEPNFDAFIASLELQPGEELPKWKLPAGWKTAGPRSIHTETVKIPGDRELEMTITPAKGGVESNAGRWLEQLGRLKPRNADGYSAFLKEVPLGSTKGVKFNAVGPKLPQMGAGMMGR
jgi:hypothetical protein